MPRLRAIRAGWLARLRPCGDGVRGWRQDPLSQADTQARWAARAAWPCPSSFQPAPSRARHVGQSRQAHGCVMGVSMLDRGVLAVQLLAGQRTGDGLSRRCRTGHAIPNLNVPSAPGQESLPAHGQALVGVPDLVPQGAQYPHLVVLHRFLPAAYRAAIRGTRRSHAACWEPGGQDSLSALSTFGSRTGHTAATPTSIL